jgi:phenylacetate-CoA ligase
MSSQITNTVFLDEWLCENTGLNQPENLNRALLDQYHLNKIRETLEYAASCSSFYRQRLSGFKDKMPESLKDFSQWPFTSENDIRDNPLSLLCTSQSEISHVVTLHTSGTFHQPKRIFFTDEELEHTISFFHHGLRDIKSSGERILILMPGENYGSIGDLLHKSASGLSIKVIKHGLVADIEKTISIICDLNIDFLIGLPAQVLALSRAKSAERLLKGRIKTAILSADYIPDAVLTSLKKTWDCKVYRHYGMTEMGYGGGIECSPGSGYHLREADFYFEVVHPNTNLPVKNGEIGEIVFTTLRRRAMPLIRYRTGDLAKMIILPCKCGSILRRLNKIYGRIVNNIRLSNGQHVSIQMLDEVIYRIPGVINYSAEILKQNNRDCLSIKAQVNSNSPGKTIDDINKAIALSKHFNQPVINGMLVIEVRADDFNLSPGDFINKRRVNDRRDLYE